MMFKKNLIYKVGKKALIQPSNRDMKNYFINIKEIETAKDIKTPFFISFTHNSTDGLCIHFFTENYSVGITYNEFLLVAQKLKKPEEIMKQLIAGKV